MLFSVKNLRSVLVVALFELGSPPHGASLTRFMGPDTPNVHFKCKCQTLYNMIVSLL